jgi:hypothetical protein
MLLNWLKMVFILLLGFGAVLGFAFALDFLAVPALLKLAKVFQSLEC